MQAVTRVSDNLRRYRRDAGLSQEQLAKLAEVGSTTVARIEAGGMENPRVKTLVKLGKALGIDPRDLMPDED